MIFFDLTFFPKTFTHQIPCFPQTFTRRIPCFPKTFTRLNTNEVILHLRKHLGKKQRFFSAILQIGITKTHK